MQQKTVTLLGDNNRFNKQWNDIFGESRDLLIGGKGEDYIMAFDGDNYTINSGDGDDIVITYEGDDVIEGGKGNDRLESWYGNDTYIYNLGDGNDTIVDYSYTNEIDKIVFGEGISAENLTAEKVGDDYVLMIGESGETITIKEFFYNSSFRNYKIE